MKDLERLEQIEKRIEGPDETYDEDLQWVYEKYDHIKYKYNKAIYVLMNIAKHKCSDCDDAYKAEAVLREIGEIK